VEELKKRFIELYEASGWSQAEIARRMDMTRGGINGIITGPTNPTAGTVKYLELILLEAGKSIPSKELESTARAHIAEIEKGNSESAALALKLNDLHRLSKDKFLAAKTLIESMHYQISYDPTVKAARKKHIQNRAAGGRGKA
jgi:transcriptional regulator with XRE-family HTH domain